MIVPEGLWVVVPARGGSTRVPNKNLRGLANKPLLVHTLEVARDAGLSSRTLVSSDNPEILSLAIDFGVRSVERPTALADSSASTESALLHAIDVLSSEGHEVGWVMTLPPTSPFRTVDTVKNCLAVVAADSFAFDCLMTVSEDRRDFWRHEEDGTISRLFKDAPRRQQDRAPLLEENSAVYLTRVEALRACSSILGNRVQGYVIDPIEAWDINTETDLILAEALVAAGKTRL